MIIPGQKIREYCTDISARFVGTPIKYAFPNMIDPFVERTVSRSGKSFGLSVAGYDIRIDKFNLGDGDHQTVRMQNGDFILASSLERIKMPNDLICFVKDKSSWAREGLAVQNTVLEPGWEGFITLELSFHRPAHHVVINHGDPIAQLIFHRLEEAAEMPYAGKYQNQPALPVEAIKEVG